MKDTGGSAFPWCGDLNETPFINLGMTLRDYFAAKAMQGLIARIPMSGTEQASFAYLIADAMLTERNK